MAGERVGGVRTPVVIGAVVIALVIGLALGVLLGPDGDTPQLEPAPEPSTTTPSTLTEPPSPAEAPPACTEEAAVDSAVEWMQRFTTDLYLDDEARRAAVSEVAAAAAETELQRITSDVAESLREAGLTPEAAAAGVTVALPAGYRVLTISGDSAAVAVWSVSIAHLGEARPLRSSWDTQTTDMSCEDGVWRLVSIRSDNGPVPELAAQGDGELNSTLEVIESFTEFDHAP